MQQLKKLGGWLLALAIVVFGFVALKSAPSLLWPEKAGSLIRDEGFQAGHQNIGINEKHLQKDAGTLLFSKLKHWRFQRGRPTPPPEEIAQYNNSSVKITGFMYPLEAGKKIKAFCLLRTTQTCCYGPKPQFSQYVLVEMNNRVSFERFRPVQVEGTFFVEPRPDEGYIYRMEGKTATVLIR